MDADAANRAQWEKFFESKVCLANWKAKKYADIIVDKLGIRPDGISRLLNRINRNPKMLEDKGFDVDDVDDIVDALKDEISTQTDNNHPITPAQTPREASAGTPIPLPTADRVPSNNDLRELSQNNNYREVILNVDRFKVKGILGEGGMGRAFHCEYLAMDVAVKEVSKESNFAQFLKEIAVHSSIHHPRLVGVLGIVYGRIDSMSEEIRSLRLLNNNHNNNSNQHQNRTDKFQMVQDLDRRLLVVHYCANGALKDLLKHIASGTCQFMSPTFHNHPKNNSNIHNNGAAIVARRSGHNNNNQHISRNLYNNNVNTTGNDDPSNKNYVLLPLPLEELLLRIVSEVAQGLAFLHSRDIVHLDLKPANVFLDAEYHALVGDFGLATELQLKQQALDTLTATALNNSHNNNINDNNSNNTNAKNSNKNLTIITQTNTLYCKFTGGTLYYLPPEAFIPPKTLTKKADVYSFSILLHNVFISQDEEQTYDAREILQQENPLSYIHVYMRRLVHEQIRPKLPLSLMQHANNTQTNLVISGLIDNNNHYQNNHNNNYYANNGKVVLDEEVLRRVCHMMLLCWRHNPKLRPEFEDIAQEMAALLKRQQQSDNSANINNNDITNVNININNSKDSNRAHTPLPHRTDPPVSSSNSNNNVVNISNTFLLDDQDKSNKSDDLHDTPMTQDTPCYSSLSEDLLFFFKDNEDEATENDREQDTRETHQCDMCHQNNFTKKQGIMCHNHGSTTPNNNNNSETQVKHFLCRKCVATCLLQDTNSRSNDVSRHNQYSATDVSLCCPICMSRRDNTTNNSSSTNGCGDTGGVAYFSLRQMMSLVSRSDFINYHNNNNNINMLRILSDYLSVERALVTQCRRCRVVFSLDTLVSRHNKDTLKMLTFMKNNNTFSNNNNLPTNLEVLSPYDTVRHLLYPTTLFVEFVRVLNLYLDDGVSVSYFYRLICDVFFPHAYYIYNHDNNNNIIENNIINNKIDYNTVENRITFKNNATSYFDNIGNYINNNRSIISNRSYNKMTGVSRVCLWQLLLSLLTPHNLKRAALEYLFLRDQPLIPLLQLQSDHSQKHQFQLADNVATENEENDSCLSCVCPNNNPNNTNINTNNNEYYHCFRCRDTLSRSDSTYHVLYVCHGGDLLLGDIFSVDCIATHTRDTSPLPSVPRTWPQPIRCVSCCVALLKQHYRTSGTHRNTHETQSQNKNYNDMDSVATQTEEACYLLSVLRHSLQTHPANSCVTVCHHCNREESQHTVTAARAMVSRHDLTCRFVRHIASNWRHITGQMTNVVSSFELRKVTCDIVATILATGVLPATLQDTLRHTSLTSNTNNINTDDNGSGGVLSETQVFCVADHFLYHYFPVDMKRLVLQKFETISLHGEHSPMTGIEYVYGVAQCVATLLPAPPNVTTNNTNNSIINNRKSPAEISLYNKLLARCELTVLHTYIRPNNNNINNDTNNDNNYDEFYNYPRHAKYSELSVTHHNNHHYNTNNNNVNNNGNYWFSVSRDTRRLALDTVSHLFRDTVKTPLQGGVSRVCESMCRSVSQFVLQHPLLHREVKRLHTLLHTPPRIITFDSTEEMQPRNTNSNNNINNGYVNTANTIYNNNQIVSFYDYHNINEVVFATQYDTDTSRILAAYHLLYCHKMKRSNIGATYRDTRYMFYDTHSNDATRVLIGATHFVKRRLPLCRDTLRHHVQNTLMKRFFTYVVRRDTPVTQVCDLFNDNLHCSVTGVSQTSPKSETHVLRDTDVSFFSREFTHLFNPPLFLKRLVWHDTHASVTRGVSRVSHTTAETTSGLSQSVAVKPVTLYCVLPRDTCVLAMQIVDIGSSVSQTGVSQGVFACGVTHKQFLKNAKAFAGFAGAGVAKASCGVVTRRDTPPTNNHNNDKNDGIATQQCHPLCVATDGVVDTATPGFAPSLCCGDVLCLETRMAQRECVVTLWRDNYEMLVSRHTFSIPTLSINNNNNLANSGASISDIDQYLFAVTIPVNFTVQLLSHYRYLENNDSNINNNTNNNINTDGVPQGCVASDARGVLCVTPDNTWTFHNFISQLRHLYMHIMRHVTPPSPPPLESVPQPNNTNNSNNYVHGVSLDGFETLVSALSSLGISASGWESRFNFSKRQSAAAFDRFQKWIEHVLHVTLPWDTSLDTSSLYNNNSNNYKVDNMKLFEMDFDTLLLALEENETETETVSDFSSLKNNNHCSDSVSRHSVTQRLPSSLPPEDCPDISELSSFTCRDLSCAILWFAENRFVLEAQQQRILEQTFKMMHRDTECVTAAVLLLDLYGLGVSRHIPNNNSNNGFQGSGVTVVQGVAQVSPAWYRRLTSEQQMALAFVQRNSVLMQRFYDTDSSVNQRRGGPVVSRVSRGCRCLPRHRTTLFDVCPVAAAEGKFASDNDNDNSNN